MSDYCRPFLGVHLLILSSFVFISSLSLKAQMGQVQGSIPHLPASQWENPAFISDQSFQNIQLDGSGNFWLSNNQFTLEDLIRGGNSLSAERKEGIISQLERDNRFQQGFFAGGLLNFRLGEQNWLLSFQRRQGLYLYLQDSVSAGLLLRGNAPYAGQEVQDDRVEWRNLTYASLGLGSSWKKGPISWGFHLKLVQGISAQVLDRLSYTLLTASDGSQINLQADYDAFSTTGNSEGLGLSIDLGATYQISDQLLMDLAIRNLGWINWDGTRSANQIDVQYEGVQWDNFIETGGSTSLAIGDTLQQLIFPDSVEGRISYPLPASARIGLRIGSMSEGMWTLSLSQGLSNFPPTTPLPLVHGGYMRGGKYLSGGVHGHVGGMDIYGLGLWGELKIPFSRHTQMGLYVSFPNILGLVLPEVSRGLEAQGGVYVKL